MSDFAKDTNTMDALWKLYDAERMAKESLRQQLAISKAEGLEQARLLGMSGEREAVLRAKIDAVAKQRDDLLAALKSAVETIEWMHGCTAPADDEVEKAIREGNAAIASVKGDV